MNFACCFKVTNRVFDEYEWKFCVEQIKQKRFLFIRVENTGRPRSIANPVKSALIPCPGPGPTPASADPADFSRKGVSSRP